LDTPSYVQNLLMVVTGKFLGQKVEIAKCLVNSEDTGNRKLI